MGTNSVKIMIKSDEIRQDMIQIRRFDFKRITPVKKTISVGTIHWMIFTIPGGLMLCNITLEVTQNSGMNSFPFVESNVWVFVLLCEKE